MNLNEKIVSILKRKKLKMAVAESCTGGMLSSAITSVSGASKVFLMGLVTYSNQSKMNILKVPKKIIQTHGAVSVQCCLSMVNNLSKISNNKLCISVTGIAGPKGGSKQKPVGLVYIGIKKDKIVKINRYVFKNKGRNYIQKAIVNKTLKLIINFL
tara:strand:+ start:96 stop:563 length:468 start_codon:yes stop_codon:yes gene_type:complete